MLLQYFSNGPHYEQKKTDCTAATKWQGGRQHQHLSLTSPSIHTDSGFLKLAASQSGDKRPHTLPLTANGHTHTLRALRALEIF